MFIKHSPFEKADLLVGVALAANHCTGKTLHTEMDAMFTTQFLQIRASTKQYLLQINGNFPKGFYICVYELFMRIFEPVRACDGIWPVCERASTCHV